MSQHDLLELIKQYKYPQCCKGTVHDYLNMLCVDERCENFNQLEALCSMCIDNNSHKQPYHAHKNLKKFLRDLLQLADCNEKRYAQNNDESIEKRFKQIAKEFQILGEHCFESAKNVIASHDYYKSAREAVPPEQVVVKKIIEEVCTKGNERNLQHQLKNLTKYVEIQNGMLKLSSKSTREYRADLDKRSENYLVQLDEALDRLPKKLIENLSNGPGIQKLDNNKEFRSYQMDSPVPQRVEYSRENYRNTDDTERQFQTEQSNDIGYYNQNQDQDYNGQNRQMLEHEIKKLGFQIEQLKKTAVEEANKKGTHGVRNYWRDWDELATNARAGWGNEGKHSTYPVQTQPAFCYKCFNIYQEYGKQIEILKKDQHSIEEKLRYNY